MSLSYSLISQFAKITNDNNENKKEIITYGTIVKDNNSDYVKIDGSDLLTPYSSTVALKNGDRVVVSIKNHSVIVTGSTTNPAASSKSVTEQMEELAENTTCNLVIESSRGTVFKSNQASTILSVVIYRGKDRITNITDLRTAMGNNVYLQWKWRRINDNDWGVISGSDNHISEQGFKYTITPADIDNQVSYMCELINT